MAVSGAPVRKENHTEPMAAMALDMIDSTKAIKDPSTDTPVTITIGIDNCNSTSILKPSFAFFASVTTTIPHF